MRKPAAATPQATGFPDDPNAIPIRADLSEAIARAWRNLAGPGTWWTGEQRVKIAAEARMALYCPLCRDRKAAISPFAINGHHHSAGDLPDVVIDAVHRIRTDASRLTKTWLERCFDEGLTDCEYVELVGVVATVTLLDTFALAMGHPDTPLPAPRAGEPTGHRPRNAKRAIAWVPTLAPEDLTPDEPDIYTMFGGSVHIQRALSLVPQAMIEFFDLDIALYLPQAAITDFTNEPRAITHKQIELIAARASAINACFY